MSKSTPSQPYVHCQCDPRNRADISPCERDGHRFPPPNTTGAGSPCIRCGAPQHAPVYTTVNWDGSQVEFRSAS